MLLARLVPFAIFVSLIVSAAVGAAEKIPTQPVTGKIDWVYNYAEGQAAARQSGKPLFVVFRCEP